MSLDLEFLAINAKKEGVKITPSGLQYKVLQEGNGEMPTSKNTVEVHYEGSLVTGDVFDSSYQRGKTISFPLKSVIPGWTEGLQLMRIGSIYELYIPYQLGYGDTGYPPVIPPKATLVFKVELLSFL
jgi:FKBP-type peptidyl-prolyl cis-trans isomerase FkpA